MNLFSNLFDKILDTLALKWKGLSPSEMIVKKKKRNGSNVKRESLACNNFDRVMMIADRLLARRAR